MFAWIHAFFASIVAYLHQNPSMGSLLAFLISFAESLPLIGTIVPGSITMTAMGALVGAGILPAETIFFWSIFGAFCGDFIGYGIGYYFQDGLQKIWPFRRYPHWIEKGEKFFQKHGGKSIILGRFIGPARSAVPMIAGLLRMKWWRFAIAAIPSAMMWAVLYILPGVFLGALSLEIPASKTTEFVLGGLLIIATIWLLFWSIQYFFRQLGSFINRKIDQLWNWLSRHHGSKTFIYLITNRESPKDHYQLTLSILAILFFALFLGVFLEVKIQGILTHLNAPIFHVLQSFRTPRVDNFLIFITNMGYSKVIFPAAVLLSALLCLLRQWRPAVHLLLLACGLCFAALFFKHLYFSPRPEGFFSVNRDSSFPSGHVTVSLGIISFVAYLITQRAGDASRYITYILSTVLILLIAFSRLYLGAHWFTDVLAATFLSLSILFAIVVSYRRHRLVIKLKTLNAAKFSIILILAFAPFWALGNYLLFSKIKRATTPYIAIQTISTKTWWNNPSQYLPLYRNNRFGAPRQPFNLQWLGNINEIQNYLSQHGWILYNEKLTLKSTLQRFASKDPQYHLQILPVLYLHQKPIITMIQYLPNHEGIFVLRLWRSAILLSDNQKTLWVGSLYLQFPPLKWLSLHHGSPLSFMIKNNLLDLLGNLKQKKSKIIVIPAQEQPQKIRNLNWNGEILVIKN